MIDLTFTDLPFIVAAYGVILGGLGLYTVTLLRRLRHAHRQAKPTGAEQPRAELTRTGSAGPHDRHEGT